MKSKCPYCKKPFQTVRRMRGHTYSEHGKPPDEGLWSVQRGRAKKRDKYRCRICGKQGYQTESGKLHVHHRVPRRCFAVEELAHFQENLLTLCDSHHKRRENLSDSCPSCDHKVDTAGDMARVDDSTRSPPIYQCKNCGTEADFRAWLSEI